MPILAIFLMSLGILSASGFNVLQRWLIREPILSPRELLLLQHSLSLPILLSAFFWWNGLGTAAEKNSQLFWEAAIITSAAAVFIQLANAHSRHAEASLVAPIQAMTPGLITLTAFSIGERPTLQGTIGILLITLGTYLHGREGATTLREYLQPFRLLALPANFQNLTTEQKTAALKNRTALRWAYGSATVGTIGLLFDSLAARNGDVVLSVSVQGIIMTASFLVMYLLTSKGRVKAPALSSRLKAYFVPVLAVGTCYGLQAIFYSTAFRIAPIAYLGSFKRLTIIVTIIFSSWFLHEKKATKRLWPASIITGGAILLAMDGSTQKILNKLNTTMF